MLLLQNVVCESEYRCEPVLRGESYHGVCFGQSHQHTFLFFISVLFSIVPLSCTFFIFSFCHELVYRFFSIA